MASKDEQGIKLFGKLISSQEFRSQSDGHDRSKGDHGHDEDQTAEKRPDKIIPCPRCKSIETKFCYFNNYNVNQPRHFCRGCQRYWTAGGALRNVPVGAGRRKTKLHGGSGDGCFVDAEGGNLVHPMFAAVEALDGFRHGFTLKRRRDNSYGQPY